MRRSKRIDRVQRPQLIDGEIVVGGTTLSLISHRPIRLIGEGANGFVVLCHNELLQRDEAVKFWATLRLHDSRDKIAQGMEEARKAASVNGQYFPQIFSAGILKDSHFYCSMEYVEGITLQRFLDSPHDYYDRLKFAGLFLSAISDTSLSGILHGDAHTRNVIVQAASGTEVKRPHELKLLDFGTSLFTRKSRSAERHWRVVRETFDRMFNDSLLYRSLAQNKPSSIDAGVMVDYFKGIYTILFDQWFGD